MTNQEQREKHRLNAMKALAIATQNNKILEREIKGYIEMLECTINGIINDLENAPRDERTPTIERRLIFDGWIKP